MHSNVNIAEANKENEHQGDAKRLKRNANAPLLKFTAGAPINWLCYSFKN
jgi:hypothetical protein